MKKNLAKIGLLLCNVLFWLNAWAIDVTGWTCSGVMDQNCGVGSANGVVANAPVSGSTGYAWISTMNALSFPVASLPTGIGDASQVKNGATFRSAPFAASANTDMSFYFNYVTSDGSTDFTDFAWARLLDGAHNQVALLFTARTHPTESVVPGVHLPAPQATLSPTNIPIVAGGPNWDKLGKDSDRCFDSGCGYSGWIHATYKIAAAGTYQLEIGVVNWGDESYASGLAVDGLLVAGSVPSNLTLDQPPSDVPVGTTPTYSGTVANPGGITTVSLRVTGPGGYSEDLQATIQPNGTYSTLGAALPSAGTYTVVATLAGTTLTQVRSFQVLTTTPLPSNARAVPLMGSWGLAWMIGLLSATGAYLLRRKK